LFSVKVALTVLFAVTLDTVQVFPLRVVQPVQPVTDQPVSGFAVNSAVPPCATVCDAGVIVPPAGGCVAVTVNVAWVNVADTVPFAVTFDTVQVFPLTVVQPVQAVTDQPFVVSGFAVNVVVPPCGTVLDGGVIVPPAGGCVAVTVNVACVNVADTVVSAVTLDTVQLFPLKVVQPVQPVTDQPFAVSGFAVNSAVPPCATACEGGVIVPPAGGCVAVTV
jgi:hypothetical protein